MVKFLFIAELYFPLAYPNLWLSAPNMPSSNTWRITLGAAVGIALIGALAMYLRRRKRRPSVCRSIYLGTDTVDYVRSDRSDHIRKRTNKSSMPNGGNN